MEQNQSVESDRQGKVRVAPVLRFEIRDEVERLRSQEGYARREPAGRTLVKEPDLRIVLMALDAGARIEAHQTSGPIAIQVLEGRIRVSLPHDSVELSAGQFLALEPGIEHDVEALDVASFLLTIGRTTYHDIGAGHHGPDGSQA